jgi:hypothetical protein
MTKVFISFEDNWADEFDVYQWAIVSKKDWEAAKESIIKQIDSGKEINIGFGSNQWNTYNSAEELLSKISIKEISSSQEKTIREFVKGSENEYFAADLTVLDD